MQTQVTFRHLKSSQELQNAAQEATAKFEKYNESVLGADVVFTQDVACVVEIFAQVQGGALIAKESSEDFIKSLNLASDKIVRQLRKHKTKESKFKTEGIEY
jgi:putative sigma-54 modulation protein